MQINYQFRFNLTTQSLEQQKQSNISTLFCDLFPHLKIISISSSLIAIQTISLLVNLSVATVFPELQDSHKNIFNIVFRYLIWLIIFIRLGSECEVRIGQKYYFTLLIIIQIERLLLLYLWRYNDLLYMITSTPSLAVLYIPLTLNLSQWQANNQINQQQHKVVENYDLLDLNDTVIKMRPMDMNYTYESFTNRQFHHHNLPIRDQKSAKSCIAKKMIVQTKINKIMQEQTQQYESQQIKIYKLIILHFVIYSHHSAYETFIFVCTEVTVFVIFYYKLMTRLWPKNNAS